MKAIGLVRLTHDPETKQINDELTITKLRVADNIKYKDKEKTFYLDIDAFGKRGEVIAQYFSKGDQIYVEVTLETQTWEKDGEKRSKTSAILDDFKFVGKGNSSNSEGGEEPKPKLPAKKQASKPAPKNTPKATTVEDYSGEEESFGVDDEVPF